MYQKIEIYNTNGIPNMKLDENYPTIAQFLAAWFPDCDFENLTDQEIIADYRVVAFKADVHNLRRELEKMLQNEVDHLQIENLTNRQFSSEEECRSWLQSLLNEIVQQAD